MKTIRLTMAQALVRFLVNQRTLIDGKEEALFPGVFATEFLPFSDMGT